MNFRPELAAAVMAGEKTVTRRLVSTNPRSPWWEECGLRVGRDYAVCPGRAKHAIGRAVVTGLRREPLGYLTDFEAQREGFAGGIEFERAFAEINGVYDRKAIVWRVELQVVDAGRNGGPAS